jgi:hypothetical protein
MDLVERTRMAWHLTCPHCHRKGIPALQRLIHVKGPELYSCAVCGELSGEPWWSIPLDVIFLMVPIVALSSSFARPGWTHHEGGMFGAFMAAVVVGATVSRVIRIKWIPLRKVDRPLPDIGSVIAFKEVLAPLLAELGKADDDAVLLVAPPGGEHGLTVIMDQSGLCARSGRNEPLASSLESAANSLGLPVALHAIGDHAFFDIRLGRDPSAASTCLLALVRRTTQDEQLEWLRLSVAGEGFVKAAASVLAPFVHQAKAAVAPVAVR